MTADRRAALVEKANTAYYRAGTMATPEERMAAAVSLIRAEVLEEAARVANAASVEPGLTTNERMLAHGIAAAIRARKNCQPF